MADARLFVVEDLRVEYLGDAGSVCVVDDVSFRLSSGESLGLAGESGSGKTSVVLGALRLLPPPAAVTGGRVLFRGEDVMAMTEERLRRMRWAKISLVMQSAMNALNPVLTVGEQICDAIEAHATGSQRERVERAAHLLSLVGIDPGRIGSYPHELSGGMRQRAVIAMALALRPEIIVMDEPTTALDVIVQKEIMDRIAELKRELGFSTLLISHDLQLMLEYCDRVAVMYAGGLVETAAAGALVSNPLHPYSRALLRSFPDLRGSRAALRGIPGAPPDIRKPPSGCRFHPRCEEALSICAEARPALRPIAEGRLCACHRVTP